MLNDLPKFIAHRGASARAPENTLAAFRIAKEMGAQWIEFDVQLTSDEVAVVFHDEMLNRTTDKSGLLASFDLQKIKQCDAGSWFSATFAGEAIPTLAETLACCVQLQLIPNIELKALPHYSTLVDVTLKTIGEILPTNYPRLLSSFCLKTLLALRTKDKHTPIGVLYDYWKSDWQNDVDALDAVAVHLDKNLLNPSRVHAIKSNGLGLLAYTVNDSALASEYFALGVDSLFTDKIGEIQV